jgi:hypothetical protein
MTRPERNAGTSRCASSIEENRNYFNVKDNANKCITSFKLAYKHKDEMTYK